MRKSLKFQELGQRVTLALAGLKKSKEFFSDYRLTVDSDLSNWTVECSFKREPLLRWHANQAQQFLPAVWVSSNDALVIIANHKRLTR